MKNSKKKVGEVLFRFYEYPDGTWEVKTVVHDRHLPNPEEEPRAFMKMGLMAADLNRQAQNGMKAIDTLLVGKEEMKVIMDEQDKINQIQTKLPFEEDTDE